MQERREKIKNGEDTPSDLLGTLLMSVDPKDGSTLTDEELWEDVHDVMGAGHETTGTTTAAVLYCVSTHPEVEEKLMAELRTVCGEPSLLFEARVHLRCALRTGDMNVGLTFSLDAGDEAPTYEDLEKLTYLKQVVKEVLRLYPAIPMFPREASCDDILPTGHRVDAGAALLVLRGLHAFHSNHIYSPHATCNTDVYCCVLWNSANSPWDTSKC